MDELVGMCGIHTPTLASDMERNQPWFKNDRCNRHPADEPRPVWDKKWLQRFKELMPSNCDFIATNRKSKIWRTDI